MEAIFVKEHKDGSATYIFDLTQEESRQLLNLGIITALKQGIEEGRKLDDSTNDSDSESSVGDSGSGKTDCIYGTCVESDRANCNSVCGSSKVSDN